MSTDNQRNNSVRLNEFLDRRAVFTMDELDRFLSERGSGNTHTRNSLLAYYRKQGRIVRLRRGLYATVPWGMDSATAPIDPFLVAARMTGDAVLGYHTALEFHGRAYSVHWRLVYVSATKSLPLTFQSHEFRRAPVPPPLLAKGEEMFGVTRHERSGVKLRVTSHERTMVDALDRPDLTGTWEEIWRVPGIGGVLRFGTSHRVHPLAGERDHRREGRIFPGTAQGAFDGGGDSPRRPAQAAPEAAPSFDAR